MNRYKSNSILIFYGRILKTLIIQDTNLKEDKIENEIAMTYAMAKKWMTLFEVFSNSSCLDFVV